MNSPKKKTTQLRPSGGIILGLLAMLTLVMTSVIAQAQEDIRLRFFRPAPLRLTVSVNTTNSGTFTNQVNLSTNIVGGVTLSVSNLPAGCGYDLVTTNGSAGASVTFTNDQALSIVVNSTNLAQGEYTFYLMGTGGATNRFPLMLQSCYIWQGTNNAAAQFNNTFSWTNSTSWVGGNNPGITSANDVFFGDLGAQTNRMTANNGNLITFTNIQIDQDIAVGSLRFGPGTYTNLYIETYSTNTNTLVITTNVIGATNALFHHVRINNSKALTVTGSKGFSLLRDYIAEYGNNEGSKPDRKTGLIFSGGNGARVVVSNTAANFSILLDGGNANGDSFLIMTNIGLFQAQVNRMGLGEFLLYPNYREMNMDTNGLGAVPRLFVNTVHLARTNFITAYYTNADNYLNDNTRAYAISWLNGETSGNGSSLANNLFFGLTNRIFADSICLVGANHASGNAGFVRFNPAFDANAFAIFRNTNGTGRMALFTVSDGGGTNRAGSNIKANVDFSTLGIRTAIVDIMADRFYIARDRSMIAESNTVNYQGTVMFGRGTVDVNTAILGYQEHQVQLNNAVQLGYCQGNLTVTNQGTFKVNGLLTLGYTADTNALGVAQQYNTYGRVTVNGATLIASNIVVDGGPRNYSHTEGFDRSDSITLIAANLTVTNSIGNAPGQPLNSFSMERSTNVFFVNTTRTNLICRQLATPGTDASVIKVAGITGVSSLPATIPIISYEVASSPYLKADMSSTPGTNGYLLNNTVGNSIDLFLTTNAPRTLLWTGSTSGDWDTNTANWIPIGGGAATKFTIGDIAVFDDTSTRTNVTIIDSVVPGQSGAGVLVSNYTKAYTFSGGTVAGTSLLLKVGTGSLNVAATKQGPVTVLEGSLTVDAGGVVGLTTVASNVIVNVLASGTINGGLSSTGAVVVASGGAIAGSTTLAAGSWLDNSGTITTTPGPLVTGDPIMLTNQLSGIINAGNTQWNIFTNSTLANFGTINNLLGRLNIYGFMFGNGSVADPDGPGGGGGLFAAGIDGRLEIRNPHGILSPGGAATNSIGSINVSSRFDFDGVDNQGWGTLLIEVDKSNVNTNDRISMDYWSNIQGKIMMRNINPGLPFADGDAFLVLSNNNGANVFNQPDNTIGDHPLMDPIVPGAGLQWDLTDFRNYGVIKVKASPMIWRGNLGSTWDLTNTLNWVGGIAFTNNAGAVFDDSAVTTTVNVSSIVAPGGYSVTTNIPSPGTTNVFTNSVGMSPSIIVSNSGTYLFSSTSSNTIEGWSSLYKTGSGTLDLGSMSNRFTGQVIVDQGTVVVSVFTNSGVGAPLGAGSIAPDNRQPAQAERFIMSGGSTLRYTGPTWSGSRGLTIGAGGATIEISNSAANLFMGGTLRGEAGALTKVGAGTLTLSAGNTFTNVTVNNGMLRVAGNDAAGRGHIIVNGGSLGFTNNASISNLINLLTSTVVDATNTTVLGGSWIGTGNVTITNRGVLVWTRDLTNYSGDITFVGSGTNRFNNATNSSNARGSAATVFDLGASARLENFNGGDTNGALTYHLGGLAGGAGAVLAGRSSNNIAVTSGTIYSIGAKGSSTTFSGSIIDGSGSGTVAVVKVGSGTLALNGVNTYTGTTTVSDGTLGGSGSIASALTVGALGAIAPGNSVGTFTVSNTVSLGGTTLMELNPAGSDLLRVTGALTGGGTLTVTNTGGTLTNGTVFTLFSQLVTGFTSTNLPAGYVWTVNLGGNGTITVVSGGIVPVNTTPTNITSSVSGGTLTLSWPSDHTGWTLQTQTNLLSVGLTTATNTWFPVAGSSATNSVAITIDPTQPTVFYRLVYP